MSHGSNGATALKGSLLTEIYTRRAAITEEQVIGPEGAPPQGATVVTGDFPLDLKRLYTLRHQLVDEHNALVIRAKSLIETASKKRHPISRLRFFATSDDDLGELEEKRDELRDLIGDIDLFCLKDLLRAFPELGDKADFGVAENWQVYWLKEPREIESDEDIPAKLKEVMEELAARFGGAVRVRGIRLP